MPIDSTLVLTNNASCNSGTDGTGTGSDPTANAGAVVQLKAAGKVGVVLKLGEPASNPAQSGQTLDILIEASPDGGSTWDTVASFRRFDGAEVANMDVSTGSPSIRRAVIADIPLPDASEIAAGRNGCKVRANITASTTTNWNVYLALVDENSLEDVDRYDNVLN